jgi:hypothetical protein
MLIRPVFTVFSLLHSAADQPADESALRASPEDPQPAPADRAPAVTRDWVIDWRWLTD